MNLRILFSALLLLATLWSCEENTGNPIPGDIDYRQEMRSLVQSISAYGRFLDPDFMIIPQNGEEIITVDGVPEGPLATGYIDAIDGIGREALFFGYDQQDNQPTPPGETSYSLPFLNLLQQSGKTILVTDYTDQEDQRKESIFQCQNRGFIPFTAPDRELSIIPEVADQPPLSGKDITQLAEAESFLYLVHPEKFNSRTAYLTKLAATTYDVLVIDLYFEDKFSPLTSDELQRLRSKPDGNQRLLIAYMNIGEADPTRYYWHSDWDTARPYWMESQNEQRKGNYTVRYWEQDWKEMLIGNKNSYLKKIVDAGFDGVFLDVVDGYTYFE